MARNIHSSYFEDDYIKYECQTCKRSYILGERMAEGMTVSCPYCQSFDSEATVWVGEERTAEMDMGCLGIYFHKYPDGQLMLYTGREFAAVMTEIGRRKDVNGIPLGGHIDFLREYCEKRDCKR